MKAGRRSFIKKLIVTGMAWCIRPSVLAIASGPSVDNHPVTLLTKKLATKGSLTREDLKLLQTEIQKHTDQNGMVTPTLQDSLFKIEKDFSPLFASDAGPLFQTIVGDVGGKMKGPIGIPENSTPYWLKDPGPLDHFRSSELLPKKVNYLVVGGGLTGASTANNLTNEIATGKSVIVLERGQQPASGASGRNGGNIEMMKESFIKDYRGFVEVQKDILKLKYPNLTAEEINFQANRQSEYLLKFFQANVREIQKTVNEHKISADVSMAGWLRIAETEEEDLGLKKEIDFAKKMGINFEIWSPEKIKAETGIESKFGGRFIQESGNYHPFKYVNGLFQAAIKKGVGLYTSTDVTKLEKLANGNYLVHTNQGTVEAEKVVLATNGYTRELLPEMTYLEPRTSIIINFKHVIDFFKGMTVTMRKGDWYANFPGQDRYTDAKGVRRGTLHVGGGVDTPFPADQVKKPPFLSKIYNQVRELTAKIIPSTKGQVPISAWSGVMAFFDDRAPVLSFYEKNGQEDKHLVVAIACNGYGGSQCAYAGKMAAEMAKTGETPAELPPDLFSMRRMQTDKPLFTTASETCGNSFEKFEAKN